MAEPDETPPITWLSPEDFDALVQRLDQPSTLDPAVARVLLRQAPWNERLKYYPARQNSRSMAILGPWRTYPLLARLRWWRSAGH